MRETQNVENPMVLYYFLVDEVKKSTAKKKVGIEASVRGIFLVLFSTLKSTEKGKKRENFIYFVRVELNEL
jgi:hypothetical protein